VIRAGHVWFHARGSPDRIWSQGDSIDVLYALDQQTVSIHAQFIRDGGVLIYDPEKFTIDASSLPKHATLLAVPTLALARKYASEPLLQGSVAMGVCTFLMGMPFETLKVLLEENFGGKKKEILESNLKAADEGYKFAQQNSKPLARAFKPNYGPAKLLITGNQAVALGAAVAGCKILVQYPMTPATALMHWMAPHATTMKVMVKQAEDEIAAINMAIGASAGGIRAMTASSGGGVALMVEAMGLAGMAEVPLVVVLAQRSGPSTGLPTKTEQGDLNMLLGAGQGEFPRAILGPGNVIEAFHQAIEAFELAEKWQTLAVIAIDFTNAEDFQSVDIADFPLDYEPASLFTVPEPKDGAPSNFKRYAYTASGVSPRSIPGQKGLEFVMASDEHDERGYLISDVLSGLPKSVEIRKAMMEKRMRKLAGIVASTAPPKLEGPKDADVTIVAWGSTASPVRDALTELNAEGVKTNFLFLAHAYPLHTKEITEVLTHAKKVLLVECNFSGQIGRLIRTETGIDIRNKLLKYDGEPFYPHEIVRKVKELARGGGN
jgi:2-oxoglutarate ferredoxin oxidoreductase subunit alpha